MSDRRADWDDDRLDAAFAARTAARSAPEDIEQRLMGQLRSRPQRPTVWHPLRLVTAAGVLVALGLGALVAQTISPRPSVAAIPSAAASELQALGLVVMTPSEAADVRDRGRDDRELAVHGWFRLAPVVQGSSCAPILRSPVNPALPQRCGETGQRIVEAGTDAAPESTSATNPSASNGGPTAIRPLFPMLDQSALTVAAGRSEASGVEIVAVGHFDDRRSTMCGVDEQECRDTYVVDRLLAVDGAWVAPSTGLSLHRLEPGQVQPMWTAADVDSLVAAAAPGFRIVSRLAIPGERIFEIEPALGTGAHGIVDRQLVWVVNGLEARPNEPPRVGTILLIDGDPTVAFKSTPLHVSAVGFVPFALAPLPAEATATPSNGIGATPVAAAPANMPTTVLGLPVLTLSEALKRSPEPGLIEADTELAVAGWFIQPPGSIDCPPVAGTPGPIEGDCPTGLRWLTESPQRLAIGPSGRFAEPARQPAINPVIRPEVPFAIPDSWIGSGAEPLPVVVIGHFGDRRANRSFDSGRFVIDALVWAHGASASQSTVVLGADPTDTLDAVLARIDAELDPAMAEWAAVVRGSDLTSIDPDAVGHLRELTSAEAVWIVRRLVVEGGRPVVRSAYVADGSARVWAESEFAQVELVTRIEVPAGSSDSGPVTVEVVDGPRILAGARAVTAADLVGVTWTERAGPDWVGSVQVAAVPRRDTEILIRWMGGTCDEIWRLEVYGPSDGHRSSLFPFQVNRPDSCHLIGVSRTIVLRYRDPVAVDDIGIIQNPSGG